MFIARRRDTDPSKPPQFSFDKKDRRVTVLLYLWDADFGPRSSRSAPTVRGRSRSGSTATNGQTPSHPDRDRVHRAVQQVRRHRRPRRTAGHLRSPRAGTISVFFQRWLARLPLPLGPADADAGYWWELSMAQVEVSRTWCSPSPTRAASLRRWSPTTSTSAAPTPSRSCSTARSAAASATWRRVQDQRHHPRHRDERFYKHSWIKQYLKDGRALRIETVINALNDLRAPTAQLDDLQAKARGQRPSVAGGQRVGRVLANPVFEPDRAPHRHHGVGRRATAMRFGDFRPAPAGALCVTAVTGITNRSHAP